MANRLTLETEHGDRVEVDPLSTVATLQVDDPTDSAIIDLTPAEAIRVANHLVACAAALGGLGAGR